MQEGILKNVGECLRSSVGLGPSVLLAKTGSDMKKPGGLTVVGADKLPGMLFDLDLGDLSGIGNGIERRLRVAGVSDVAALWALSPSRARNLWGSIEGERFCYALHGRDPPEIETERYSIGHSHVLGPALHNVPAAYQVARRLLARAASRLRRAEHKARGIAFSLRVADEDRCEGGVRLEATSDTFRLLEAFDALWARQIRAKERLIVLQVGVTLYNLVPCQSIAPDLFGWTPAQNENAGRLSLSSAIDQLNQRYGVDTVAIGTSPAALPGYMGAKIAFSRIPDAEDFKG